jgi:hypothetical protein
MITIFSTPRPFVGEFNLIQRNAIKSWILLGSQCQIILFNDEENTTKNVARELGVEFVDAYNKNEFGTPLMDSVFASVRALARHEILAHVNTDIILFPDFVQVINDVAAKLNGQSFLMLGRRWDLDIQGAVDFFQSDWAEKLISRTHAEGKLHGPAGMDYWVFPKNAPINPPPFCVGRPSMDTWLVFRAKTQGITVLDATEAITIIHQQHGYPKKRAPHFEVECNRNVVLAGGRSNLLTLRESDYLVSRSGNFENPPFARQVLSRLSRYAAWRQLLGLKRKAQRWMRGASR